MAHEAHKSTETRIGRRETISMIFIRGSSMYNLVEYHAYVEGRRMAFETDGKISTLYDMEKLFSCTIRPRT